MPKTPLRALRVPDELWRAAQARARDCSETVSEVVRRALADYVGTATAAPGDAGPGLSEDTDSQFLIAQGMVMQRHGLGPEEAATYLRETAGTSGRTVKETVTRFMQDRPSDQPSDAHGAPSRG